MQHEVNVSRAYRLGKSETFWNFVCLLAEQDYSVMALRRQIEGQLAFLATAVADAPGDASAQQQEFLGQADACRACLGLIDGGELSSRALGSRIIDRLFAAWPPDYLEYRRRYIAFVEEDPMMQEKVDCLQLREWYDTVDALHYTIDRTQSEGQPRSKDQVMLEILLLRVTGERSPIAD